ncbi:MAG: hypothetical protein WHX53_13050, partial [Anaerolineae bacterium]
MMLVLSPGAAADAVGDYRSKATGNWGDAATWQVFTGTKWVDASVPPTSANGVITVRSGYTVTIAADVSVDQLVVEAGGTLIIGSTSTMTLTNDTGTDLTVAGTLLNQGTFSRAAYATWAVAAGGVYIHNTRAAVSDLLGSAVSLDAQSTFIYRGSSSLNPPVSLSDQTYGHLTFESTAGSWTPTLSGTKTLTVKGTFTIGKDVTFNAITGRFTGPITLQGNWTNNGTFNSDAATGTVTLNGINPQTIGGSSPTTFNSLTISNTKSLGVTLAQDITVNGTLTLAAGATLSADTYTITAGGDWANNGTFNAGTGKVIFNRSGTSAIGGSSATTFYDLEIGANTTIDVSTNPLFNATHSVRNYGRLRQTQTVGTDNVAFLNLSSGTYRGVEVDPSGSTPMGSVTVTIYGEQNCPSPPVLGVTAIKRCFDIAAATPVAATVRFWYDATNELNGNTPGREIVYYQNKDRWYEAQGTYAYSSSTFNSVAVTDISTFSRFALSSNTPDPANLIVLARFEAAATAAGVELLWETLSETDTAGFHLWRSEQPDAGYVRITPALLPARGGPTRGALYTYTDTAAPAGRRCYYRLEEIDVYGASAFYGPAGLAVVDFELPANARITQQINLGNVNAVATLGGLGFAGTDRGVVNVVD